MTTPGSAALTSLLLALAVTPAPAQIVPMTALLSVPAQETLRVELNFMQPFDLRQICFYTVESLVAPGGGEGGCVNLPGGVPSTFQSHWIVEYSVPNATALCGLTLLVLGVQENPFAVGGQVTTVTCANP